LAPPRVRVRVRVLLEPARMAGWMAEKTPILDLLIEWTPATLGRGREAPGQRLGKVWERCSANAARSTAYR
jgi:hypothetical protein